MQGPKAYLAQQVPPPNPTSEPHYTELITQHRNIDTRLGGGQRYCLAGEGDNKDTVAVPRGVYKRAWEGELRSSEIDRLRTQILVIG